MQVVPEIGHGDFEALLAKVQGIEELTVLGIQAWEEFGGLSSGRINITINSMMSNYFEPAPGYRLFPIRGWHGCFHLLHDAKRGEAVLIDAGLMGEMGRLRRPHWSGSVSAGGISAPSCSRTGTWITPATWRG